jgi:CRP-like cAMP-binding protein
MASARTRRSHFPQQNPAQNRLLAQFPTDVYRQIAPELEPVALQFGEVVYEAGDRVKHLYFPNRNTMLSLLCTSQDANAVEVAVTGWEGFAGFPPLMGGDSSPHQVISQIPGAAVRIKASSLYDVFQDGRREVRSLLLRYVQALLSQISQTALCNRVHSVEERLARWALVSRDRTEDHQLPLTHEFLARMLGVNRSTVSLTAATLQRAGLIHYSRGKFTIHDRERLQDVACDCYRIVREQYRRLGIF